MERLALLRKYDRLRDWRSVNDVRACMCCERKLSGRLIQIWAAADSVTFRCPATNCFGTLPDFAQAGDPLFDDEVWNDWCKTFDAESSKESWNEEV